MLVDFPIRDAALALADEYTTSATMIAEYLLDGYSVDQIRHALDVFEACSVSISTTLADIEPAQNPIILEAELEPKPAQKQRKASPRFHRAKPLSDVHKN
jgi:hypothetical protein